MRLMIRKVPQYFHVALGERNLPYQNRANRKQIKIKKHQKIHPREVKIRIQNHKHLDRSLHKDFLDQ